MITGSGRFGLPGAIKKGRVKFLPPGITAGWIVRREGQEDDVDIEFGAIRIAEEPTVVEVGVSQDG